MTSYFRWARLNVEPPSYTSDALSRISRCHQGPTLRRNAVDRSVSATRRRLHLLRLYLCPSRSHPLLPCCTLPHCTLSYPLEERNLRRGTGELSEQRHHQLHIKQRQSRDISIADIPPPSAQPTLVSYYLPSGGPASASTRTPAGGHDHGGAPTQTAAGRRASVLALKTPLRF